MPDPKPLDDELEELPPLDNELEEVEPPAPSVQAAAPQQAPKEEDLLTQLYNLTKAPRAVGYALTQGPLQQYGDEAAAALDTAGNWLRSKAFEHGSLALGAPTQSGRGMGAPLHGYDDYVKAQRAAHAKVREESPTAYDAANLGSDMLSALLLPEIKGVKGAQLGNVAVDALIGGTAAMGAADGGDPVEAAKSGAMLAGGASGALRAVPAAARLGRGIAKRVGDVQSMTYSPEAREAARELTALTPQGREARAAALRGEEGVDDAVREVTRLMSDTEALQDQVLDYARVGLKKKPIADAMAAEGVVSAGGGLDTSAEWFNASVKGEPIGAGTYLTRSPEEALPYLEMRGSTDGDIRSVKVKASNIASEADVKEVAKELDIDGYVFEMLDDPDVVNALSERGFDAARFTDLGPDNAYEHETLMLLSGDIADVTGTAKVKSGVIGGSEGMGKISESQQELFDDLSYEIEALSEASLDRTPVGKSALRDLRNAVDAYESHVNDISESGPDAAAEIFMRLDGLKRAIGKAVKKAGRGQNPDVVAEESLQSMYGQIQQHLMDPSVWGEGAAAVQREVNEAWTPWLSQRRGYAKRFLTEDVGTRGASGWDVVPEADPSRVGAAMRRGSAPENEQNLRILRQGVEGAPNLTQALTRHYNAPEELMSAARQTGENAARINQTLDRTLSDLDAAQKARALREASSESRGLMNFIPGPNAVASGLGRVERIANEYPRVKAAMQGAVDTAGALASVGPRAAAPVIGTSVGQRSVPPRDLSPGTPEGALAILDRDPEAFGQYGPFIRQAAEQGDMETFNLAMMAAEKASNK